MSKKYEVYFFEYKDFHLGAKNFWVADYDKDIEPRDTRCLSHSPTGERETREISKEEYDALPKAKKLKVMVREKKEEAPKVDADVNGDGVVDEKDIEIVEKAAKKAKKKKTKKKKESKK